MTAMTEPISFTVKPALTGERVLPRPVREADAAGLVAMTPRHYGRSDRAGR